MNTESRSGMNQGDPGLGDISGRAWWMQNGRRRGWRDQAAQEAGTRLELGREQRDGYRLQEVRAGAERTCRALTLRAPPSRVTPMADVQDAGDRGNF